MLPGLILLLPTPKPGPAFQRCVSYFRSKVPYSVDVDTVATAIDGSTHSSATIVRRSPTWASVEIRSEPSQYIGPFDWIYELKSGRLVVFDVSRGAYEHQKAVKSGEALALLADPIGKALPEAAADLMSPDQLSAFFGRFSPVAGWKHSTAHGIDHWSHKGATGSVVFDFDPANGRILNYSIEARKSTFEWHFRYHRMSKTPPLVIPPTAVHLLALRLPPARPHYNDHDVQSAVNRAFDAYSRTLHLHISVRESSKLIQMWRNGDAVAQVGDGGGWSWGAGRLTVWIPGKGVYQGKCLMESITQYLEYFQLPAEPMVRDFILDNNFAAKLFTPEFRVKEVGSMTVRGVHLTLLDLSSPLVRVSLGMNDTGLITTLDSSTVDGSGKVIGQSSRQFTYGPVKAWPKPPPDPMKPLPKIKLS